MWETSGLGSEDLLWSGINFIGGIAGQREGVCGAISAAAIYLGLRHRCPLDSKEQAKSARATAREQMNQLALSFKEQFGDIICEKLTRMDSTNMESTEGSRDSGGIANRCIGYVKYVIEKLYELEKQ